jgi:hypothetical protein
MSNAYTDLTSPFSKIEALFENQEEWYQLKYIIYKNKIKNTIG